MASKTMGDARTMAQTLLNDVGTSTWSNAQQIALCNEANRLVYSDILDACQHYVVTRTRFTINPNVSSVDLSDVSRLGAVPYRVMAVESTWQNQESSTFNPPVLWRALGYEETIRQQALGAAQNPIQWFGYCIMDGIMYLAPTTMQQLFVTVSWVPEINTLTANGDALLNGKAAALSAEVGYYLAWLMNARTNSGNKAIELQFQQSRDRIRNYAPEKQTASRSPQRIRARRF